MKDLVYLDVEFTQQLFPDLLSLGLVTSDGQEHYLELDPSDADAAATMERASSMAQDEVLSQFGRVPGAACSRTEMGLRTVAWLTSQAHRLGQPVRIAFDFPSDYEMLEGVLRDCGEWPAVRSLIAPYNAKELSGWFEAGMVADETWQILERQRGLGRHHALADAHALRAACIATLTGKRVKL